MADIVKSRFIRKVLKEESERLLNVQTSRIKAKLESRSGALLNNRSAREYGSNGDFEGIVEFVHPAYERFLDMVHLGGREKGKHRQIHNKPVMEAYNRVAWRLMNEFTEAVQQQLKDEIQAIREKFAGGG